MSGAYGVRFISISPLCVRLRFSHSDRWRFSRAASSSLAVLFPLIRRSRLRRRTYKRALPLSASPMLVAYITGALALHAVLPQDRRRARVRPPRTDRHAHSAPRPRHALLVISRRHRDARVTHGRPICAVQVAPHARAGEPVGETVEYNPAQIPDVDSREVACALTKR
jgi:hypothetical protein